MKKLLTSLSVISLLFIGFSLLLAVVLLMFFWEPTCVMYSFSAELIAIGPIIPIGTILRVVLYSTVALILLLTVKSQNSMVVEIISILVLSIFVPVSVYRLSIVQSASLSASTQQFACLSLTSNILTYPLLILDLSSYLCLVVCGMRIAKKFSIQR